MTSTRTATAAAQPSTGLDMIAVDLAMLYTVWGRATLLHDVALADELASLIHHAVAGSKGAALIDTALASLTERDVPFERSAMDLAIAKLVASSPAYAEFRMFSLHGTEIAGYLVRQLRTEYIGTPRRSQFRHSRVTELLPTRTAMSAFQVLSRGSREDHAVFTDFEVPSQLAIRLGTPCARYKLLESRHFPQGLLSFHDDCGKDGPIDAAIPVRLTRRPDRAFTVECTRDADLLRLHAAMSQARWMHLESAAFSMFSKMPTLDQDGDQRLARFHAHRALRVLTGIPSGISLPVPAPIVSSLFATHRWFVPSERRDWLMLLRNQPEDLALSADASEGWLIS